MKLKFFFILCFILINQIHSEQNLHKVFSNSNFSNLINQSQFPGSKLSIVLFYKASMDRTGKLLESFKKASQKQQYVNFIQINLEKGLLNELAKKYKIEKTPAIVLFKDGRIVRDESGNPIIFFGILTRDFILNVISNYFDLEILEIKKDLLKEELKNIRKKVYIRKKPVTRYITYQDYDDYYYRPYYWRYPVRYYRYPYGYNFYYRDWPYHYYRRW